MSGNSFRWPVQGRIISGFGTRPDGGHNDGINVSVPQGTSVMAAENGVVAYAGDELKGYGNLVLIRHSNNWVSAYAHNDELLVKRGDKVRRGQVIAKAGATGSVEPAAGAFRAAQGLASGRSDQIHEQRHRGLTATLAQAACRDGRRGPE